MDELGGGAPDRSTPLLWTAVLIAVAAFVLGMVGYLRADVSFLSSIYSTLQLFTLNFVAPKGSPGPYPVALEIARFLAPVVTLLAAAAIAARLFRDEFDRTTARSRFRGAGGHVVVCGLGAVGTTIVRLLRARGHHVVAIERDRTCPAIATVRSLGVPVVVGDALVGRNLARAGIGNASLVIWTTGGFAVGSDVATSVVKAVRGEEAGHGRRAAPGEIEPPACLVRVRDLGLCELLRRAVLEGRVDLDNVDSATTTSLDPDVDYFNEWENTAQRLIWDTLRGYAVAPGDVDLWIVGTGPLAEALLVQAVRTWRALAPPRTNGRLTIHLFDDHATEQRDRFAAAWPEAAAACSLVTHDGPAELVLTHARREDARPAGAAFVLVDGRDRALELGLRLRELEAGTPVAVAVPGSLAQPPEVTGLAVFDPVAAGLDSDVLFLDTYAALARMIHERYLNRYGIVPDEDASGANREWDDLEAIWRESNRDAARFVVPNLVQSGFQIRVPTAAATHVEDFDDGATSGMAEREHERWRRFMEAHGYERGPERNDEARMHPGLVKWAEASDEAKDYTCVVIRDYPRLLAQLGYEVWRVGDTTAAPSEPPAL